jgi:hypothetical protein
MAPGTVADLARPAGYGRAVLVTAERETLTWELFGTERVADTGATLRDA